MNTRRTDVLSIMNAFKLIMSQLELLRTEMWSMQNCHSPKVADK